MPFCPSCRAEYKEGVKVCPSCDEALKEALDDGSSEDSAAVYVCYDAQLASRVQDLLQAEGLEAMQHDGTSTAFPTTIGTTGKIVIAVPAHERARAASLIRDAVEDGVLLSTDGELV